MARGSRYVFEPNGPRLWRRIQQDFRRLLDDLIALGASVGLTSDAYVSGVREGRYEDWAAEVDEQFQDEDPNGTPYAVLEGRPLDTAMLYDPDALGSAIRG